MKLLLSGYYGFGNTGDEAVLAGILATFKRVGIDAGITVLSADPERTKREHPGVDAVHRMRLGQLIKAIRSADLMISGGGSLFQDVTSSMSLRYYLFVLRLARVFGKKTMVYAQGIGPLSGEGARRSVVRAMNRTDLITVRDADSKAMLESIGVTKLVHLSADPSFLLEPDLVAADGILDAKGLAGRDFIGVSLRAWQGSDWARTVGEAIKSAAEEVRVPLAYIPMQEPEDSAMLSVLGHDAIGLTNLGGPAVVKGLIARCGLVVGMRLHALIFAAGVGTPFVPLVYDPKVASFAASVGQGPGTDIASLDAGVLRRSIVETWQRREEIASDLLDKADDLTELALQSGHLARTLL